MIVAGCVAILRCAGHEQLAGHKRLVTLGQMFRDDRGGVETWVAVRFDLLSQDVRLSLAFECDSCAFASSVPRSVLHVIPTSPVGNLKRLDQSVESPFFFMRLHSGMPEACIVTA
jgi:hypothetical protein